MKEYTHFIEVWERKEDKKIFSNIPCKMIIFNMAILATKKC